jgi:hypothetical protein
VPLYALLLIELPTPVVRDSSAVRRLFFLLELWDVRELYIRKTADLPLQLAPMIGNKNICLFVYVQIISHDTLR